jgi:hypothetical protein
MFLYIRLRVNLQQREDLMRCITFLTGIFILGLMTTEKANTMMEIAPSSKPAAKEEREMPLVTPPQEEMPLESPLEEALPTPTVLNIIPSPEVYHQKAKTKHHRKTAGSRKPLPYLPTLEEQMKLLCQKRSPKDLKIEAMTTACEALGCSSEYPHQPCDLKKK